MNLCICKEIQYCQYRHGRVVYIGIEERLIPVCYQIISKQSPHRIYFHYRNSRPKHGIDRINCYRM